MAKSGWFCKLIQKGMLKMNIADGQYLLLRGVFIPFVEIGQAVIHGFYPSLWVTCFRISHHTRSTGFKSGE
jgi:hypothetical protein